MAKHPAGAADPAARGAEPIRLQTAAGRWTVAAAVLGSGAVFLEGTVVHVALPAIARDFDLGIEGLQWVVNGYLLTLSALMLLGGSLGDVYGRRRVFILGLVGFAVASALAALVPSAGWLVAVRCVQGASGALLVPNSLALVDTTFAEADRGAAIGRWAGWSAITTALGPLLGGWLVDAVSWRWVFASVVPLALVAAWIAHRRVPDVGTAEAARRVDYRGATLATLGLAGVVAVLVSGPSLGFLHPAMLGAGAGGLVLLLLFVRSERRHPDPLLPPVLFRSRAFTGANVATLLVYTAIGGVFFLLVLQLQNVLGYSALQAGAALLPISVLMLLISPWAGRIGQRIGPRWPMAVGMLIAAGGAAWLSRVQPGSAFGTAVLPAVSVFGLGLGTLVAPLTAAVLGAVPEQRAGIASAVNNAAARLAGLFAASVLPLVAGLGGLVDLGGASFADGYARAMWIGAALCAAAALISFVSVRTGARVFATPHPNPLHGCSQSRRRHDLAA